MAAPVAQTGAGNVTSANNFSATSITVNKPANVADGDVLVAVVSDSISTATITPPSGWNLATSYNVNRTTAVYYKYIATAAGESASNYTWSFTGGNGRLFGAIFRVTGADGASPIDATGSAVSSGTTSIVDPAVTAVDSAALLLAVFTSYITSPTPTTITKPGSMATVLNGAVSSATASQTVEVDKETLSASGTTGTRTATVSPAGSGAIGMMFTMKAGAPPPSATAPVVHTGAGNVTTATVGNSAILQCIKPSNTANADLLVAQVVTRNGGVDFGTVPPGWTKFPNSFTTNGQMTAYWRYVTDASGEPSNYTWRSANGSGRGAVIITRVTGAAPPDVDAGPVDSYGAASIWDGSGTSAVVAPALTVVSPSVLLLGMFFSIRANVSPSVVAAPSGMASVGNATATDSTNSLYALMASQTVSATGSSGTKSAAISPAGAGSGGLLVAIAPADALPYGIVTPPVVTHIMSGGVGSTTAKISAVTKFVNTGTRVAVSVNSNMSSPTYSSSAMPDRDGLRIVSFTGLTADTKYYYGVEMDGITLSSTPLGSFKTFVAAGTPHSFSWGGGSCADTNSNASSFTDFMNRTGPDGTNAILLADLGDQHYENIHENNVAWALGTHLNALGRATRAALLKTMPIAYTYSDHDSGDSNDDSTEPALPAIQSVYRRLFPSYTLPGDGVGLYQTWQIGRVLFLMTDGRSYASPIANTDNSSKTKLGTTQKTWWKAAVTSAMADPDVGLIVWLHEDAWAGASTFGGDDTWTAYATERAELVTFLAGFGEKVPLMYVHGDYHCLGADDGSHVPGGFPVISCSPWDQTPFNGNGTWSQGFYPNPATGSAYWNQYGWFDVIDDGTEIVVRWKGISAGAVVLTMIMSWGREKKVAWGAPI